MKKEYTLIGVNGNAFCVMNYVSGAMRECGKSKEERDAYLEDAKSGDYIHLLAVSDAMIDRLNAETGK
jgi:hypothetical protein